MVSSMRAMRIGTLNLGHQTLRPRTVPVELLDALLALETDVFFLTEYVASPEYSSALGSRWKHVMCSEQVKYSKRGWLNQVAAFSRSPLTLRPGHVPTPDHCARSNFLSVEAGGLIVTGVRAPAYRRAKDWYAYWDALRARLDGHVVIGDFNVDPVRGKKRDRVLPEGWQVISPPGRSYRSSRNGSCSAIDHALVRPNIEDSSSEYRPEFFDPYPYLEHCPLVVELSVG